MHSGQDEMHGTNARPAGRGRRLEAAHGTVAVEHSPPPRKELERPLTVLKIWPEDGRRTFFGYAANIGRGGLRIDATSPREPQSRHHLEIPLPTGTLECRCEVVWKRSYSNGDGYPPAMGLRFLDLPEERAVELDDWVHRALDLWRRLPRHSTA